MRQFTPYFVLPRIVGSIAAGTLLVSGGCRESAPTEPPPPAADAGVTGISNANSVVCARNAAGTSWCTRADAAGVFVITSAELPPGTGTGTLPVLGQMEVYNVDCRGAAKVVDRGGPQRN